MNLCQRSEDSVPTISGRKLNNNFTCTVKEVRKLSPQFYEQLGRQKTFQTDSFKQILTKRSGCPSNKENISIQNKVLKRIKQERLNNQNSQENKKISKSNDKRVEKKSSTVSLTKIFKRNQSTKQIRKKEVKSVSPSRDFKDYRSGPVEKKNYLSNNASQKNKQVLPNRSEKSLTDRMKNPVKLNSNISKKQLKQDKKQLNKTKKSKNTSKISANNKKQNYSKTQALAKQFDQLLKGPKSKVKTLKKKKNTSQQKGKKSKSKEKKVIVSHNNSKNYISRNKLNSHFSDESAQSPEKAILSTRYQNQKHNQKAQRGQKKKRLSFQPSRKKGKSSEKAKTQALSPQKNLSNKNEAATTIQKTFRGYLTRKYIQQFKRIILAVLTIQKWWRGYRARKKFTEMKQQKQKNRKKQLKIDRFQNFIQFPRRQASPLIQNQLASLLEQILNEQNVNEKIKHKINDFLKKQEKINSSRSSSIKSHMQQQMRSQKRFFQQNDKKKNRYGSPLMKLSPNPRLQKSDLHKSPEVMIENLLTIKQFQREKLINNAKLQIEGLESLALKNIFSPRTRDVKRNEIHQKLTEELNKFDESISEVIKSCKDNEDAVGPIKPFEGHSTPEKISPLSKSDLKQYPEHSPLMQESPDLNQKQSQKLNSSQRKLQDLSMQLLQYYEQKTHSKHQRQYQKLDSSYQFIEQYLLSLFEFLRQMGYEYRQNFINVMRTCRNLQIGSFLKNLNVLTEDSDEDMSFKLPMYKYLEQEEVEVLSPEIAEQFNNSNPKLQKHQLGLKVSVEDLYLKMIIDAVNEALNLQRPNQYMFTQTSLYGKSNRMRILQLQALEGLDGEDNEPQFSFYFANSMNHIYKWAHLQCGKTTNQNFNEQMVMQMNEGSLKQYLKYEAHKEQNYYDELLQVIVALGNCIFDQIILEEGVDLYM